MSLLSEKYRLQPELDIWVIPNMDQLLGFDARQIQKELEQGYPVRRAEDEIAWGECQWVEGDHSTLKYRGNVLKRGKMWLQRQDPLATGFVKYFYTGWQYRVLPATAPVKKCPEMVPVWDAYDSWAVDQGYPKANHAIVTHYVDGLHNIGKHFDKPNSMLPGSLITVVKTGECGRPFYLARRATPDVPFFHRVVEPGTAIVMTVEANLQTLHAVPALPTAEACGSSGSIVFRSITENVSWGRLELLCARKEADKLEREEGKKRKREEQAMLEQKEVDDAVAWLAEVYQSGQGGKKERVDVDVVSN